MIRVAVCDDDVCFTTCVEELLLHYDPLYDFEIDIYFDGDTLINGIEQGRQYELIFLDIMMVRVDGIRAAQYVRSRDKDVVIVFISGYGNYMKQLFSVHPSAFLQKPVLPEEFRDCLKSVLKEINGKMVYYSYVIKGVNFKTCLKDIVYFESKGRKIFIHTARGTDSFYKKLSEVEDEVNKSTIPFLRIHQSFLVNYHYIFGYSSAQITLLNGKTLPVSLDRQKEIRRQYNILLETK